MQYASGGDLHNWIQKNFTEITWNKQKLSILWQISKGYILIKYLFIIISDLLIIFLFILDLKLFIMQNLYIEIFIVETYYLIYQNIKDING